MLIKTALKGTAKQTSDILCPTLFILNNYNHPKINAIGAVMTTVKKNTAAITQIGIPINNTKEDMCGCLNAKCLVYVSIRLSSLCMVLNMADILSLLTLCL